MDINNHLHFFILSIPFFISIFWLFWWICLTSNVGKIFRFGNMYLHELWPNVIVWFSQNNSWIKSTFRLKNNSILFTLFFFIANEVWWLALPTKYLGFQFHGSDTNFKLMNGSFHWLFHSFMYRVYIEGNHHCKNGKEWYKEGMI